MKARFRILIILFFTGLLYLIYIQFKSLIVLPVGCIFLCSIQIIDHSIYIQKIRNGQFLMIGLVQGWKWYRWFWIVAAIALFIFDFNYSKSDTLYWGLGISSYSGILLIVSAFIIRENFLILFKETDLDYADYFNKINLKYTDIDRLELDKLELFIHTTKKKKIEFDIPEKEREKLVRFLQPVFGDKFVMNN